jgi:hypothetical protein
VLDPFGTLLDLHLIVDALGGLAKSELAERRQRSFLEEALERAPRLFRYVDLAFLEPLEELAGGQIDEAYFVRLVEDSIGYGLANDDAGNLRDDVVEALDVLDVDRRVDVDSRVEELLDVLPSLRVA